MNEDRISMKFTNKISEQNLNKESLIRWCKFKVYDEMLMSLESRGNVLPNSSSNGYFLKIDSSNR